MTDQPTTEAGTDGRERCQIHEFQWHPGDDCPGCPVHPGDVPPITCTCQATPTPARLRRLRTQLAAEHAKAVRADQQPRPDLDHLRVTAHSGIAAGLETALFFVDHHLREAGEQAGRTTVNNPVARRDAADNPLREQYAAAIRGCAEEGNIRYGHVADAVLAVRDREMEQYAAAHLRDQAALTQIRLHIAVHRQRLGLADPVLLAKVEAVLREVGELEAAEGGGGA